MKNENQQETEVKAKNHLNCLASSWLSLPIVVSLFGFQVAARCLLKAMQGSEASPSWAQSSPAFGRPRQWGSQYLDAVGISGQRGLVKVNG